MSFEIALTGLNAASSDLEVISNNIANAATTGFKRSTVSFSDVYGSAGLGTNGNIIGQGVRVTNVAQQFMQGDITFTDRQLDVSISGEGFFRVNDNGTTLFTRAGSFGLDREGYIVNGLGHRLTGFPADDSGQITPISGDIRLNSVDSSPRASDSLDLVANLDAGEEIKPAFDVTDSSTYNFSTSTTVYDSLGAAHLASLFFQKTADSTWNVYTFVGDTEVSQAGGDVLVFGDDGMVESINGGTDPITSTTPFTPAPGTAEMTIDLGLGDITQFGSPFSVNEVRQSGFASGRLSDFDVSADGVIYGHFSNGVSRAMGQITLSNFTNFQGLAQAGSTSWLETATSGNAVTGVPGSALLGVLQSGSLEEANVDVTEELVKMIGVQRNFQANAQAISANDTLTQTIMNIRR